MKKLIWILLSILAITVSGCASNPDRQMTLSIKSVDYLNPNEENIAEPVTLTIFELRLPNQFNQAGYNDLLFNTNAILKSDLIDKQTLEIRPGESKNYPIDLSSDVKYIGIVASYRTLNESSWKQIYAIPTEEKAKLNLMQVGKKINLSIDLQSKQLLLDNKQLQRTFL